MRRFLKQRRRTSPGQETLSLIKPLFQRTHRRGGSGIGESVEAATAEEYTDIGDLQGVGGEDKEGEPLRPAEIVAALTHHGQEQRRCALGTVRHATHLTIPTNLPTQKTPSLAKNLRNPSDGSKLRPDRFH